MLIICSAPDLRGLLVWEEKTILASYAAVLSAEVYDMCTCSSFNDSIISLIFEGMIKNGGPKRTI